MYERTDRIFQGDMAMKTPDVVTERTLLILSSYHHMNTAKVAGVMANALNATIKSPQDVRTDEIEQYDLIGFGSGIYDGKHHVKLIELAEMIPPVSRKRAFLFSTSAIMGEEKVAKDHSILRDILQKKGYVIVDEFACKGFNTNSFLKLFGGMNKGRPNAEDLANADRFARNLRERTKN
ncbi:MAG: flavodoxin [Methanomassiliicoccales archaeon PtaU1.Bin124]|nr:MAG: flavodoxin [Methanomassiliicoccales archaeon PtaU1.Bin124]